MKRVTIRSLSVLSVVSILALTAGPDGYAATNLRFGHGNGSGEIAAELFDEFANRVAERTNGEVVIKVFPGEQLGKEVELVQQVKLGALDISAPSLPAASTLVPGLEIPSTPFLWNDWREAQAVIESEAMQPQFDELRDKHNIVPLTKIWYWGWRNLTTLGAEVRTPEDMANLKIRVPESPIWVEMIKALGAAPTPIAFSEVYTALQQKTVDGQENPIPTIFSRRFYEVQEYVVMTKHMLQNNMIIMNRNSLDKLKPEHQRVLIEEARAASAKNTMLQQGREESMLEEIRSSGRVTVIDDPDRAAFAAKMSGIFDVMEDRWGKENIENMKAMIAKLRAIK